MQGPLFSSDFLLRGVTETEESEGDALTHDDLPD